MILVFTLIFRRIETVNLNETFLSFIVKVNDFNKTRVSVKDVHTGTV